MVPLISPAPVPLPVSVNVSVSGLDTPRMVNVPGTSKVVGPEGAEILLSWPTNAGNPALFAAPDLTPPIPWQLVTNASSTTDGVNFVTLPATEDRQRFFRLPTP